MTHFQKNKIYESIMREISPIVKSYIENILNDDEYVMFAKGNSRLETALDFIYNRFKVDVANLSDDEIDKMCVDYVLRYNDIRLLSSYSLKKAFGAFNDETLNEIFNTNEEFAMEFSRIRQTLTQIMGMQNHYVELYNPFNHQELAFVKQPVNEKLPKNYIISTIVPLINKNMLFIQKFMDVNGYYLIRCALGDDVIRYNEQNPRTTFMANMCFAQKVPANISSMVSKYPYLFHVTSEKNISKIKENGLIPTPRTTEYSILNTDIHYPERTYFFYGTSNQEAINYAKADMLPGTYHLLRINTADILEQLPIYFDPLLDDRAVYVDFEVPPMYITDVEAFAIH